MEKLTSPATVLLSMQCWKLMPFVSVLYWSWMLLHMCMSFKVLWLNQNFHSVKEVPSSQIFTWVTESVCAPTLLSSLGSCLSTESPTDTWSLVNEANRNFTCMNDPSSLHSGMKTASWGFFACSSAWALSNRHLLWPASTKRKAKPTYIANTIWPLQKIPDAPHSCKGKTPQTNKYKA